MAGTISLGFRDKVNGVYQLMAPGSEQLLERIGLRGSHLGRFPGLNANLPLTDTHTSPLHTNTPWHAGQLSAVSNGKVNEVQKRLSLSWNDWRVTEKDAGTAIQLLSELDAGEKAAAVERLGPRLLTRLEDSLSKDQKRQFAPVLGELRRLRNTQVEPHDKKEFLDHAQSTLRGLLELDRISADDARGLIDGMRRYDKPTLESILDALGPDKMARLEKRLSATDKLVYAPTLQRFQGVFFGAVQRMEEAMGLGAKDVTVDFDEILKQVKAGQLKVGAEAQGYVILLAPGLVTEHQPGYFEENQKRFEARGITVLKSKLDTDADVAANRKTIADEVKALELEHPGKKVIVFSHSKGGPDSAFALRDPGAEKATAFFISMQAAYGGTPISDPLSDGLLGDALKRALVERLGAPNGNAFADLSFRAAKERSRNEPPLNVPTLNYVTWIDANTRSPLAIVANTWKADHGVDSDGLVPKSSQVIGAKKSYVVYKAGADHAAPAARPLGGPLAPKDSPGDVSEALLIQALRLLAKQAAEAGAN